MEGTYFIQLLHEEYEQRTTGEQQVLHSKMAAKESSLEYQHKEDVEKLHLARK